MPSSLTVTNYGSVNIPNIQVSWDPVSGATGYYVYRSTSRNGSYVQVATVKNDWYNDDNCKIGKTYYYKVRAYNSAGTSDYSSYVEFVYKDTRKPGALSFGSCSVSGNTMYLKWSLSSGSQYGTADKIIVKVRHPDTDEYVVLAELSGTSTSYSFNYLPWVLTDEYVENKVYVGAYPENDYGQGTGATKVYDTKEKKWYI